MKYDQVTKSLRQAYDAAATERERAEESPWKLEERTRYLTRLEQEGRHRLLEVGAGTGVHGKWFADRGLTVVCTDLSPELVKLCRAKGLEAHVMDFLALDLPGAFEAVFAMNCLLHVPRENFRSALVSIARTLEPGGLFYLGQYGGQDLEGEFEGDHYTPKRFFSRWTDAALRGELEREFEIVDFHRVSLGEDRADAGHFQSFTCRNVRT